MAPQHPIPFAVTERVLKTLRVLNVMYGAGILILFIASLVAPDLLFMAILKKPAGDAAMGMRLLMIAGLTAVPVNHVILGRLREIVLTVRAGDPFVLENARRLNTIAFALVGLQVLHVIIGVIVKSDAFARLGVRIDWSFSLTPWVAALLVFLLARVFEHGARMRADLEGTV